MSKLIILDYQGLAVTANREAWFNATEIAAMFGKSVNDWLNLKETQDYINRLNARSNTSQNGIWIKTKRGNNGGTWLHRKLAVRFAGWCDLDFAIWCDEQIAELLSDGKTWQQHRQELASVTKLKNRLLRDKRQADGKTTKRVHYINESLLENEALTGRREKLNRDALTEPQLKAFDDLIAENAAMIAQGLPYTTRKQKLFEIAAPFRTGFQTALNGGMQ